MATDTRLNQLGKNAANVPRGSGEHPRLLPERTYGQPPLDGWTNRILFSDNLIALGELCKDEEISGKVRLVYIDPPFATNQTFRSGGNRTATVSSSNGDKKAYGDHIVGAQYIQFLRERFRLLRDLLAEDGSIYVHIDYKMGHYVKVLMDEVFGQENFINDIARIKCNPKNFERKGYGNIRDMILFYSKGAGFVWNEARVAMTDEDICRLFAKVDSKGRRYTTTPLHAPGETKNGNTGESWQGLTPPPGRHWRYRRDELSRLEKAGLIEWSSSGNPRKMIFAEDILRNGKKLQDVWTFKDPVYPSYPTEKNLKMLETIVGASSNPGDIVLDCFAGSGTTLVAAEMHGRRWVAIDESEVAIEAIVKRLHSIHGMHAYTLFCDSSRQLAAST